MTCPRCSAEVPAAANFCPACAAPVSEVGATIVASRLGADPTMTLGPAHAAAPAAPDSSHGFDNDTTVGPVSPFDSATLLAPTQAFDPEQTLASPPRRRATPPPYGRTSDRRSTPGTPPNQSGPLGVGQTFGTRYHIIKVLGVGGMGAVYQAWDAELGEAVAIKVIRPEAIEDPAAAIDLEKRFKRELLLARQVTHKNVVRIHDLGEIEGIKFITMTYVDGIDLATLLRARGTLDVERALQITRSIVDGLLAAHAAGIVHRDLKPANIMIRGDGEALIMDFGIARSTGGPSEAAAASVAELPDNLRYTATLYTEETMSGSIVGTVPYMAPEQARGEEVDQRTDLYALGLIVYDMLAGQHRAKHAESAIQELRTRMERPPAPIRSIVPAVPEPLNELISQCIETERDKRFATTEALAQALARIDDHGELRPIRRVVGLPLMAGVVVLLLAVSAGIWWYQRQFIPPAAHDPVSVIIADLQNNTNDATFDRTLEPMIKRALEGAGFITAYDRSGIRGLGAKPREQLDDTAAHELAVQQGLNVVLSGSIESQGTGYKIALKATQPIAGTQIFSQDARAASKEKVLDVTTRLVTRVRSALGDDASESSQQFAMASLSATSLDVVRLYAQTMAAQSANKFDEALQNASKAVQLDPQFGMGYLLQAVASKNMGRLDDNQKYLTQALSHLDGMTERERFQTRGYAYWSTGDYVQCVKEFSDLIAKYPSDIAGRNQLALCLSNQRQMRRAMDEIRQVVKILPSHPLFRDNLALYSNYASDFQEAEQEARAVTGPDAYASLALAFAQTGQGQFADARNTYQGVKNIGALGASFAASGLGDLAAVEGRYSEAVQILRQGATADIAAKNSDSAAAKFAAIAYAELSRGRMRQAVDAANEALGASTAVKIKFLAARTFIETGDATKATPIIDQLSKELYAEPRAYAKQLQGLTTLKNGDARQAMTTLRDANDLFSTWIGSFDLGRASLAAEAFTQADSAFDVCLNARRGEALALFVDEEPTYAYLPQAYYYQGMVREGLKSAGAVDSFRQYLAIRGASTEDPLVPLARRRTASTDGVGIGKQVVPRR